MHVAVKTRRDKQRRDIIRPQVKLYRHKEHEKEMENHFWFVSEEEGPRQLKGMPIWAWGLVGTTSFAVVVFLTVVVVSYLIYLHRIRKLNKMEFDPHIGDEDVDMARKRLSALPAPQMESKSGSPHRHRLHSRNTDTPHEKDKSFVNPAHFSFSFFTKFHNFSARMLGQKEKYISRQKEESKEEELENENVENCEFFRTPESVVKISLRKFNRVDEADIENPFADLSLEKFGNDSFNQNESHNFHLDLLPQKPNTNDTKKDMPSGSFVGRFMHGRRKNTQTQPSRTVQ
eukprot:augustus_masked-scaffold_26-processed-gene-1.47-mRNA-1 protein AED:1.00 eAED:1.00 QI:0/-1/0/0/-1/1/1/0/287